MVSGLCSEKAGTRLKQLESIYLKKRSDNECTVLMVFIFDDN